MVYWIILHIFLSHVEDPSRSTSLCCCWYVISVWAYSGWFPLRVRATYTSFHSWSANTIMVDVISVFIKYWWWSRDWSWFLILRGTVRSRGTTIKRLQRIVTGIRNLHCICSKWMRGNNTVKVSHSCFEHYLLNVVYRNPVSLEQASEFYRQLCSPNIENSPDFILSFKHESRQRGSSKSKKREKEGKNRF